MLMLHMAWRDERKGNNFSTPNSEPDSNRGDFYCTLQPADTTGPFTFNRVFTEIAWSYEDRSHLLVNGNKEPQTRYRNSSSRIYGPSRGCAPTCNPCPLGEEEERPLENGSDAGTRQQYPRQDKE